MRYSYINALATLTEWAHKEGFNVSLDHNDISYIDWEIGSLNEPKIIKIEGKYNYEYQTYLMLHELGHHQIRKDWDKFKKKLPAAANAEEKDHYKHRRTTSYIVSTIEEEYLAWERGYDLATKLGIKINPKKWEKFKTKNLMGYIKFYGKSK